MKHVRTSHCKDCLSFVGRILLQHSCPRKFAISHEEYEDIRCSALLKFMQFASRDQNIRRSVIALYCTIFRKQAIDIIRKRDRKRKKDEALKEDAKQKSYSGAFRGRGREGIYKTNQVEITAELEDALEKCVNTLGVDNKRLLNLLYVEGKNSSEVASILGITDGGVRANLSRVIAKLRHCLRSKGYCVDTVE